jgi:hypothetical protein
MNANDKPEKAAILERERISKELVVEIYRATGSFTAACTRTGCPPFIASHYLKEEIKLHGRVDLRTVALKRGASAETEFQRLVPKAMNANCVIQNNCPSFDFDIGGITVDVKFSSIGWNGNYRFDTARHKVFKPDFYAAFLATAESKDLKDGYRLFLLPAEFITTGIACSCCPLNSSRRAMPSSIRAGRPLNGYRLKSSRKNWRGFLTQCYPAS